mmetsp:Transcript_9563/g.33905  ORF Transcript_9563/g.33905 Transcript_9563/m.33905 type:complete len:140 (+) Transcript_9563:297-716(+)
MHRKPWIVTVSDARRQLPSTSFRRRAMASGGAFGGARGLQPKPPEKGVFPLDHFGECKAVRIVFATMATPFDREVGRRYRRTLTCQSNPSGEGRIHEMPQGKQARLRKVQGGGEEIPGVSDEQEFDGARGSFQTRIQGT